jgi:hypothetical protein
MKTFIILFALAAAAYAESDPWYYGVGYGYHGYPYGYALGRPCVNNAGLAVPCAVGHPLVNTQARRKREADPALVYAAGLHYPYAAYHYPAVYAAAGVVTKPCVNVKGEKVDCALGHKDIATAHVVPTLVYGRKKREADPVYFDNIKAEVTEHEGKYNVPVASYAATYPWGWPVATYATAEVPYKYNTVAYKSAPVENPSDPTNPTLVHTSKLGICLNNYGLRVPC